MSKLLSNLLYMTIENTSSKLLVLKSRKKLLNEFQDFLNYDLKPMVIKKKDCFETTILKQYISKNIKFNNNLIEQKFQKLFIENNSNEMEIDIKEIDTVAREINSLFVSDKIAETNIKLQKSIKRMTYIILVLTFITTFYSIPDDTREDIILYVQNLFNK